MQDTGDLCAAELFRQNPIGANRRTRIKVCGVTNADDVQICVRNGIDAIGFMIGEARACSDGLLTNDKVSLKVAAALVRMARADICTVLLTHRADADSIRRQLDAVGPDALQIQVDVPERELRLIRRDFSVLKLIKTIGVSSSDATDDVMLRVLAECRLGLFDAQLLDTRADPGQRRPSPAGAAGAAIYSELRRCRRSFPMRRRTAVGERWGSGGGDSTDPPAPPLRRVHTSRATSVRYAH